MIIGYHGVAPRSPKLDPANLRCAPDRFRTHVEILLEAGFEIVTVAELADRAGAAEPPPGLAALSFDDGMEDNHSVLLPILREHRIPATVYVVSGLIGKPNPWLAAESGARMMTPDELRELAGVGVELGAHTVSHPDLSLLDRAACLKEMVESRATIEEVSGARVRTFAYPFCRYSPEAVAAAREAGFAAAVTCEGRGGWDPLAMKRAMITGKDGLASFLLKLTDVYQPLFDSVPGRVARLTTRSARRRARGLYERRG